MHLDSFHMRAKDRFRTAASLIITYTVARKRLTLLNLETGHYCR